MPIFKNIEWIINKKKKNHENRAKYTPLHVFSPLNLRHTGVSFMSGRSFFYLRSFEKIGTISMDISLHIAIVFRAEYATLKKNNNWNKQKLVVNDSPVWRRVKYSTRNSRQETEESDCL